MTTQPKPIQSDPSALVAIAKAANLTGNRGLERAARQELRDSHGIKLSFERPKSKGGTNG